MRCEECFRTGWTCPRCKALHEAEEAARDQMCLELMQAVTAQADAAVQVALSESWQRHGRPSEQFLNELRIRLTASTREVLREYFGESAGL